jgi:hypothetical protein
MAKAGSRLYFVILAKFRSVAMGGERSAPNGFTLEFEQRIFMELGDAGTIELVNLECGVVLWGFSGGDQRCFGESFDHMGI